MCKHCDNFDPKAAAETMLRNSVPTAPLEPAWIEKLGGIILPASLIAMVVGLVLVTLKTFGEPVHFNPETVWIGRAYLAALMVGFSIYFVAAAWHRGLRWDIRVLKTAIRWLWIDRQVRSISLRLTSINDELEYAQEDYCGAASRTDRAPELSREIVRLTEYRDALHAELDRLMTELREARPDRFN